MTRLSTGLRINSAIDDGAGLQVSTRLQTQINQTKQFIRNLNDVKSLTTVADGTLNTILDQLNRIKELSIQYRNGINSSKDRGIIQNEANKILDSINNMSKNTTFNNQSLLDQQSQLSFDGARSAIKLSNSMNLNQDFAFSVEFTPSVDQSEFHTADWNYLIFGGNFAFELGFFGNTTGPSLKFKNQSGQNFSTLGSIHFEKDKTYTINVVKTGSKAELYVDNSLAGTINGITGTFSAVSNILIGGNPSTASERSINANISKVQAWNNTVSSQQIEVGEGPEKILDLHFNEGIGDIVYDYSGNDNNAKKISGETYWANSKNKLANYVLSDVSIESLGLSNLNLAEHLAIKRIDLAINNVALQREKYGIYNNKIDYEINNNHNSLIDAEKSNSKIQNADVALESSNLVREQIKLQTSLNLIQTNSENRENVATLLVS
ncbi:hypothetical protein C1N87_29850 (plasmid) [Priestia aryabhattai]